MPGLRPPPTHPCSTPPQCSHTAEDDLANVSYLNCAEVGCFIYLPVGKCFCLKKNGNNVERRKGTNLAVLLLDTKKQMWWLTRVQIASTNASNINEDIRVLFWFLDLSSRCALSKLGALHAQRSRSNQQWGAIFASWVFTSARYIWSTFISTLALVPIAAIWDCIVEFPFWC